ncbi:MAG: DUF4406 domain-containing protein [Anaerotignaceae bacterium]
MKIIYVASPYAGDIEKNIEFAKRGCVFVKEQGHTFFCPHLLYPTILNENIPQERQLGLDMGIAMLKCCDELWCFGERISQGMANEIEQAQSLNIPIFRVLEKEQGFEVLENNNQLHMAMGTM